MSEKIDIKIKSQDKEKVVDIVKEIIDENDGVREHNESRKTVVKSSETEIIRFIAENPAEVLESGFIIYEISKGLKQRLENESNISIGISDKFNFNADEKDIQNINLEKSKDDIVINVEWNQEE